MVLGSMVLLLSGAAWVGFCYIAQKKIDLYIKNRQENVDHDDWTLQKDDDAGASARLSSDDHIHKINTLASDNVNSTIDHSRSDFQSDLSNEYQQNMFGMGRDL